LGILLPLDRLQTLVEDSDLEATVRLEIARAVWTRAVLIGDHGYGIAIAAPLAKLANALHRYMVEKSNADRARTALDILLWFPELLPHVQLCSTIYGSTVPADASYRYSSPPLARSMARHFPAVFVGNPGLA